MRKSEIERDFDLIRVECEPDETSNRISLCNAMNCTCSRQVIAEWMLRIYNETFNKVDTLFCTIYLKKDAVIWDRLPLIKMRNIHARFRRFLKRVGLGSAPIIGVLDIVLIAKRGWAGSPKPRFHLHWHFFVPKSFLNNEVKNNIQKRLANENSGLKPFDAKNVKTEGFYTPYLWKTDNKIKRRLQTPDLKLCPYPIAYIKGRYLGQVQTFMYLNPGLTWMFLQGFRRNSGRIIRQKRVQQGRDNL